MHNTRHSNASWWQVKNLSFTAVRLWGACLALRMDVACAAFALSALGCHAQLQLNIVKTHARTSVARDLAVRYSVAYANYHIQYCK